MAVVTSTPVAAPSAAPRHPVLSLPLTQVMRSEIALPLQHVLQLYTVGQPHGRQGFKTILAGPDHANFREFVPAPGHQLGFNDIKTIEVKALIEALSGGPAFSPDFREAWEIQRVVDGIVRSAKEGRWIDISDI